VNQFDQEALLFPANGGRARYSLVGKVSASPSSATISRLDPKLDSHKDADVRRALEPLVAMADMINISVLGLIHHNKSGATDPLQVVMASKAFPAVARSVDTVIPDPDDETSDRRLFGTPKNNLGRVDLPTLSFAIESFALDVEDGTASTGRLVWGDESKITMQCGARQSRPMIGQQRWKLPNGWRIT
jgi:hypothetical protein